MKIIAFEGLDKSGKHTLSNVALKHLTEKGYKVEKNEFHRYDTPTGKLIASYLKGDYNVSKETIELIMAADKQAQQDYINELSDNGFDFLILDRYTFSQFAYSSALGNDTEWISNLVSKLKEPDYDIILDIPAEVSMSRKGKHNDGVNDRYESDLQLLTNVRKNYLEMNNNSNKVVINADQDINNVVEELVVILNELF